VILHVDDSGPGVADENVGSVSRDIVESMGGTLAYARTGDRSRFTLSLPASTMGGR